MQGVRPLIALSYGKHIAGEAPPVDGEPSLLLPVFAFMADLYPLQAVDKAQEIAFPVLEVKIASGEFVAPSLQMHIDPVEVPELQGASFGL